MTERWDRELGMDVIGLMALMGPGSGATAGEISRFAHAIEDSTLTPGRAGLALRALHHRGYVIRDGVRRHGTAYRTVWKITDSGYLAFGAHCVKKGYISEADYQNDYVEGGAA